MTDARRLAAILAIDVSGFSRLMCKKKACIVVGCEMRGCLGNGFHSVGFICASC